MRYFKGSPAARGFPFGTALGIAIAASINYHPDRTCLPSLIVAGVLLFYLSWARLMRGERCIVVREIVNWLAKFPKLTLSQPRRTITISRKALHSHVEYCKSTKKRNNGVSIKIRAQDVDCNTLSQVSYIVHRVRFISTASFNLESELPLPFFSDIKCNPPIMQIRVGSNEGRVI